jgi:hypothetical protein
MKRIVTTVFVLLFALSLIPMAAQATHINLGFRQITSNSGLNLADQFGLTIWDEEQAEEEYASVDLDSDEVLFTFTNTAVSDSNITAIYIDDGTIVGLSHVYDSLGGYTDFASGGATPNALPGGQSLTPPFVVTQAFSADTEPGRPQSGNDQGIDQAADILGIAYELQEDLGFADVRDAIEDGSLRIGLHVQGIGEDNEYSEGYVNTPIPEPSTMLLLFTGLGGTIAYGWRRKRKS